MTDNTISLDNNKDILCKALMSVYTKEYFIVSENNELFLICFDDSTYFKIAIAYISKLDIYICQETNDEISKLLKDILKKKTSSLSITKGQIGTFLDHKRTSKSEWANQLSFTEKELPFHIQEINKSSDDFEEICIFNSENIDSELVKVNTLISEFDIFEFKYANASTGVLISSLVVNKLKRSIERFPITVKLLKYPKFYRIVSMDYKYNFYFLPVVKVEPITNTDISKE